MLSSALISYLVCAFFLWASPAAMAEAKSSHDGKKDNKKKKKNAKKVKLPKSESSDGRSKSASFVDRQDKSSEDSDEHDYRDVVYKIAREISGHAEMRQEGSPSYRAVDWLLHHDPRETTADEYHEIRHRYVLASLYFASNGESWFECSHDATASPCEEDEQSRFLSASPACEWYGVTCQETNVDEWPKNNVPAPPQFLSSIAFYGNNLGRGPIPKQVHALAQLGKLILEEGSYSGQIPTELAMATDLTAIQLSENELEGPLPEFLSELTKLEILILNENMFTGTIPKSYKKLTALQAFVIGDNSVSGTVPSFMRHWTQLTTLSLLNNELSGTVPTALGTLTLLESMFLHGNHLSGAMPTEICALQRTGVLATLTADCAGPDPKVECDCCTLCF